MVCSYSSTSTPISPSPEHQRKRHWKAGEYIPGINTSEKRSIPKRTRSPISRPDAGGSRSTRKSLNNNIKEKKEKNLTLNNNIKEKKEKNLTLNNNIKEEVKKKKKKKLNVKHNATAGAITITDFLSDRIKKKQWLDALQAFEMLKQQPFYHPKELTYMRLIIFLGDCGQPRRAHQLFDEMIEQGLPPTSRRYTAVLATYCKSNLLDEAFKVLELMKAHPICKPDVYTYNTLMKACVEADKFELLESLYNQMADQSLFPNIGTQNTLLKGYAKAGNFSQMEELLSKMSNPNVSSMNTIIRLFGSNGDIETMEKWYEKLGNMGIIPEPQTFNILLDAYVKTRLYNKMFFVLQNMRKLSIPWTTSTYNSLIEAFADSKDAENMEQTFEQMQSEGMRIDTKTFCCLIKGYANVGMFHKVVRTVQMASMSGIPENNSLFNTILTVCMKAGDLLEMERVFLRMKEKGCIPDSSTYKIMIDAYRNADMNDKAFALEQEKPGFCIAVVDDDEVDNIEIVEDGE